MLSAGRSAFVAAALTVTLTLKVVAAVTPDLPAGSFERRLGEMLRNQGFAVREGFYASAPAVQAERADCQLVAVELRSQGWNVDALSQLAQKGDRVLFVWQGAILPQPPLWRSTMAHYGAEIGRRMGLPVNRPLLTGIVASPGCAPESLPWDRVARL